MTPDQDRVYKALNGKLECLEGPDPVEPRWWQFRRRRRDKFVQNVLRDAGLPRLTAEGRRRYYTSEPQGLEDAGGAWSRRWCRALGLSYLDAFSDVIHPCVHRSTPEEDSRLGGV